MPNINWKSVSYIINYYLTQWTDNRMPDKRGTDNRGSTVQESSDFSLVSKVPQVKNRLFPTNHLPLSKPIRFAS